MTIWDGRYTRPVAAVCDRRLVALKHERELKVEGIQLARPMDLSEVGCSVHGLGRPGFAFEQDWSEDGE
jgi:hypothetical protein